MNLKHLGYKKKREMIINANLGRVNIPVWTMKSESGRGLGWLQIKAMFCNGIKNAELVSFLGDMLVKPFSVFSRPWLIATSSTELNLIRIWIKGH